MKKIPLFDLNYDEREQQAVVDTIASKWISSGPKCEEFQEKFKTMLNARFAYAVSNCTAALHLALLGLNIGFDDEVIVPSMTFVATANVIKYVGASPVFCDIIGNDDITIDANEIEKLITPKTKAIIVMHYGGFACHMNEIMRIAKKNHLYVIEDACHGPLSEYEGKKLGTIGDVGCFSFFSNKNMSTGEGGMIITNHEEIADRIKLLRSHGMTTSSYDRANGHSTKYNVIELGYNYRMDDIHAALGVVQLDKLQNDLIKREEIRKKYIEQLSECSQIVLPFKNYTEFASNYIMPIVLAESNDIERDKVRMLLSEKGIQTSVHYPAIHRFSIYKDSKTGKLNNTEYVADCEITIPMYSKLTDNEITYICDSIKEVVGDIK